MAGWVDQNLAGGLQHVLHRVEIEASRGEFRRFAIGGGESQEPIGVAVGLIEDLFLVGLRFLGDSVGLGARARQDVVSVGLRFVAGALLVGAGALHVVEGV